MYNFRSWRHRQNVASKRHGRRSKCSYYQDNRNQVLLASSSRPTDCCEHEKPNQFMWFYIKTKRTTLWYQVFVCRCALFSTGPRSTHLPLFCSTNSFRWRPTRTRCALSPLRWTVRISIFYFWRNCIHKLLQSSIVLSVGCIAQVSLRVRCLLSSSEQQHVTTWWTRLYVTVADSSSR